MCTAGRVQRLERSAEQAEQVTDDALSKKFDARMEFLNERVGNLEHGRRGCDEALASLEQLGARTAGRVSRLEADAAAWEVQAASEAAGAENARVGLVGRLERLEGCALV